MGVDAQEQISFRQLSIKDGLSQNSGISIAQDSTGYLWIATQDGLNRYDGKEFIVFRFIFSDITRPDHSRLGKVYVDREGNIWCIPTTKILNKFDQETKQFEAVPITKDATTIYQDDNLNYWIGTTSNGLLFFNAKSKKQEVVLKGEVSGVIYDIAQNDQWILAATDHGIVQIDLKGKNEITRLNQDFFEKSIRSKFSTIAIDGTGRQWFGTFGGGLFFRNEGQAFLSSAMEISFSMPLPLDLNILSLFVDSKERLWIGTFGDGLYMIDLDTNTTMHFVADKYDPKAIHYNDILSIYEDYTGTVWFGTDGAGLSYYDEYLEKFNAITNNQVPNDIFVDVVRAITTDDNGSIWIGTSGNGLMHYFPNTNSWTKFVTKGRNNNSLPSNRIMSLFLDNDGDLWIGTQGGGLSILDKNGNFHNYLFQKESSLDAITIWDIFKDSKNRFWLATRERGLIQFDKQHGVIKTYNGQNPTNGFAISDNIRVITEGSDGSLWIGTDSEGVINLNIAKQKIKWYQFEPNANSLSNNKIKSLYFSEDDVLWIGTYGSGLAAYDIKNEKFHSYSEKDGLANNVIYAILPDHEGNLWLSSNKGIAKFKVEESFDSTPKITNYTNYEGLATEFNTGAYHTDKDGTLYFGGLEGFYWFKPTTIKKNTQLPRTVITGMQVANEPYPMEQGMKLNHQQHTLTFTFASLQFSLPENNQFKYRLLNYDQDWIFSGNNHFARYAFLPSGEYELQVRSSNYDGVWNEQSTSINFSIAPPWYWSPWAKVIYSILLLSLVIGTYRYLKWRWEIKIKFRLKEEETKRLQGLNDFRSKLYTDISHELRTPLTLISAPIDAKLNEDHLSDADFANFSLIKRSTNRMISLADQLLDLARLEEGKLQMKIKKGNLGLFLATIARSFEYGAENNKIKYEVIINGLEEAWYDSDVIEKISMNLLSNAIKYSPAGGNCSFEAHQAEEKVHINIKNTIALGAKLETEKLFDRFYQDDDSSQGVGLGLSLVKELVSLYKGEVAVQMEKPHAVHFAVTLPLDKTQLNHAQIIENTQIGAKKLTSDREDTNKEKQDQQLAQDMPLVLIVEDHKDVRDFLRSAWKEKYAISEAKNGAEGIEKALKIVPDLILTDVRMPICTGIELCNALKIDKRTSHIPIILLTGSIETENELNGLESGADDYISKPFKLPVLEKRMDNLIQIRKGLKSKYTQEYVLKAKDIAITPTDEVFLTKVQAILDEHLSDSEFNATAFHQKVGMSRMQLHRKLQTYTGLSTTEFIRSQRLKQAVLILKTSDATINEVGYAVGFSTPSYFIKCFKETYHNTPQEYAKSIDKQ